MWALIFRGYFIAKLMFQTPEAPVEGDDVHAIAVSLIDILASSIFNDGFVGATF